MKPVTLLLSVVVAVFICGCGETGNGNRYCTACSGRGRAYVECPTCAGRGRVETSKRDLGFVELSSTGPCPDCAEKKRVIGRCPKCKGDGRY